MIKKVKKSYSKAHILGFLDPIIKEWFNNNFEDLTPAQAHAIPLIHSGENVLVASPTGSGKTLTAFLMILNELFELGKSGELENKVYCLYISPLKALANDIERNLNIPLEEIYSLAEQQGIILPKIRVGVRSGDTSIAERQKMVRKPPHILITTPESLSLIVSTKRFRFKLSDINFLIVDEIHEICNSKRGVHLSLSLERLLHQQLKTRPEHEFLRIGLSATQAPINQIAKFLVGYNKEQKLRDINIVEVPAQNRLDLKVISPVRDMNLIPFEIVNSKMYDILSDLIGSHRTTLIFTNTRSGAETVVYKLQELGFDDVAAHHGSLSKETRLDVEGRLKNGELSATVCSTSLELGIDIGHIDLVCQIGSPKSIAKGLQRIGRAGHALHKISKGRIIVFDRDDLVECAVLVKNAYSGNIDRINILQNSLDVLAQSLVGMSLEQRWDVDEAYSLVRQSYCYHKLKKMDFLNVLNYIGGKHTMEDKGVYGKVRFYPEEHTFGIRHGVRSIYNLNIGTIPQEASYRVTILDTGHSVGLLSEKFVEHLNPKDVFVLGGKSYEFIQAKGMNVYVRDVHGKKPTVPSWTGEMLPRSFDLSIEVGKFRSELGRRLEQIFQDKQTTSAPSQLNNPATPSPISPKEPSNSQESLQITGVKPEPEKLEQLEKWLMNEYYLDAGAARSIINYFIEQKGLINRLPTNNNVLIEGYIDARGYSNIIFHYCFGRRVNDALSRAYAYTISKKLNCTVRLTLSDNNFMLTIPKRIDLVDIERLVSHETLVENLKAAVRNTELFKQRFRHCAVRSFMLLRNYKGREISVRKQLRRSQRILDQLHGLDNFPVVVESYNEILHDTMDITHAAEVLKKIGNGEITVSYSDYSKIPSPFAHNIILIGISDIILMEDRSALLRELHQQVLGKVFSKLEVSKPKFELDIVKRHFRDKFPIVSDKSDLYSFLLEVGALRLFKEKGKNIFTYTSASRETVQTYARELISAHKVVSLFRDNDTFWVPHEHLKYYLRVYSNYTDLTNTEHSVLTWLSDAGAIGRTVVMRRGHPSTLTGTQAFPVPQKELYQTLKHLEKRLLIHRLDEKDDGSITWYIEPESCTLTTKTDGKLPDLEASLDFLIMQYLKYYGPAPVSEIAYNLALEDALVARYLADLEDASQVASGIFILGKDVPQYLLIDDVIALEHRPERAQPIIAERQIQEYLVNKSFETVENIDAFFDKFGIAFGVREVFLRTSSFSMNAWNEYLSAPHKKLVQGRFLNARVCYIPMKDVAMYVSAYRESPLNAQELMVLKIIKAQTGITRKELSKKLDVRQMDLKEIIEKLECNLYIARERPGYEVQVGANKYLALEVEAEKSKEDSKQDIIRKLLKGYSPMSAMDIKNYTGFSKKIVDDCLNLLETSGWLVSFKILGDEQTDMYMTKKEFEHFEEGSGSIDDANKLKILSIFDGYSSRFLPELRLKFGDGWLSPVIYFGKLIGALDLWQLSSCVEIRDITLDDELITNILRYVPAEERTGSADERFIRLKLDLLRQILSELNNLMDYYKEFGLDLLRLRRVFGVETDSLPPELAAVLTSSGYNKVQNFYVSGLVDTHVFNFNQIMKLLLRNQHILPECKFTNPLEAIKTMGGIRSDFEMRLRLDGKFYDIKEFRKNLNLAAGPIIPEYYAYCTEKDLRIYKTAKGRDLDFTMEYILENMPDKNAISSKNLFARLSLSQVQYNTARKRLYNGLIILRTPINKYVKVRKYRNLTKQYARKYVLKRIIHNFGIFSLEGLSTFTRHEYSRAELRALLTELEHDGELIKGYFIKDDDALYWMYMDSLETLAEGGPELTHRFVVSPHDQLTAYLAPIIRQRFGMGSCFIIIHGAEITGVFRIKQKNKQVKITDFQGDEDDWKAVEKFFRNNKLEILDEAAEELYDEHDE